MYILERLVNKLFYVLFNYEVIEDKYEINGGIVTEKDQNREDFEYVATSYMNFTNIEK